MHTKMHTEQAAKRAVPALRLSKDPPLSASKSGGSFIIRTKIDEQCERMEFFQLHSASFFRSMAANLSLSYLVPVAKPRWCV